MQAFLQAPLSCITGIPRSSVIAKDGFHRPRRTLPVRHQCRIIVSATTADEVLSAGEVKSFDRVPASPATPRKSPAESLPEPHDNEDSEANVDAALDELSLSDESQHSREMSAENESQPELKKPVSRPAPQRPGSRFRGSNEGRFDQRNGSNSPPPMFEADPEATYYTRCGKCTAIYEIEPKVLGRGRKVSCAVCSNVWFQKPDRLGVLDNEKEKFVDYPIEKKDELIESANRSRLDRSRGGGTDGYEERGGQREQRRERGRDFRDRRSSGRGRSQHSVFIANLPYEVTADDVRSLLFPNFQDSRISVVTDPQTGKSKGYAFCDVSSEEEVKTVINMLDGKRVKGRPISARVGRKNTS